MKKTIRRCLRTLEVDGNIAIVTIVDTLKRRFTVMLDVADLDVIDWTTISITGNKDKRDHTYVRVRHDSVAVKLHRLLMNPPKDMQIDHINENKLDNRRRNLDVVTPRENVRRYHERRNRLNAVRNVRRAS